MFFRQEEMSELCWRGVKAMVFYRGSFFWKTGNAGEVVVMVVGGVFRLGCRRLGGNKGLRNYCNIIHDNHWRGRSYAMKRLGGAMNIGIKQRAGIRNNVYAVIGQGNVLCRAT